MNGAVSLLATMQRNGVDTCFMNPGTSEMHFVAALDDVPEVRGVLCLFEGVASGAADGYARVTGRPASTLLHLGPGLGNAFANLHNARRAHVPLLNIVGDHATYHSRFDAPLESDIRSLAAALDGWYRRTARADDVAGDAADAIAASYGPPGRIATLVLPADASWTERGTDAPIPLASARARAHVDDGAVRAVAEALRTRRCVLLLGAEGVRREGLELAARIQAATDCKVLTETFPSVIDRGAGVHAFERLNYLAEFATGQLDGAEVVVLAGTKEPTSFFAYPNLPSRLAPQGCAILELAPVGLDVTDALARLCDELAAAPASAPQRAERPDPAIGELSVSTLAAAVGASMREGVIVVDESNTSGVGLQPATQWAPPHPWMTLTGGSIGYGMPVAVGASVAAPDARVLCMASDGSSAYTIQSLWTMAREGLDVTVVCCTNDSYAILNYELARVGASAKGDRAKRMLELGDPSMDLAQIARGFGVPATTVRTAEELSHAIETSFNESGPRFIDARLRSIFAS